MIRKLFCLIGLFMFTVSMQAHEILINTQEGEIFILDVELEESLQSIKDKVMAFVDEQQQNFLIEVPADKEIVWHFSVQKQGGYLGYPRDYYSSVSPAEKSDIRYIVTYLANKSLISIAMAKGELEAAGNRIDHIHPLRFLEVVFTDEEMKVGIRNIRGKGWVWNHFVGGLKESLTTESNIGNVKQEFISDFSQIVGIDAKVVQPLILSQRWDDFIDALIQKIPRKGDQDHYDF